MTDPRFEQMYRDLGICTLTRALDESRVVDEIDADSIERYARTAIMRWGTTDEAAAAGERLAENFALWIFLAVADKGREDDRGNYWIDTGNSDIGEVLATPDTLRHWAWMRDLLRDEVLAMRYLDLVPSSVMKSIANELAVTADGLS
jgi:hypothetical protein